MATTVETLNNPRISISKGADKITEIRYAMNGWGGDVICKYWQEPGATKGGRDPWTYQLEIIEGRGGKFSHVSEKGCQIAIARHLIDAGLIGASEDNAHLDNRNQKIAQDIKCARDGHHGAPEVGDFVIMPDGRYERCADGCRFSMQTTEQGSFFVHADGTASMSGTLKRGRLLEYYQPTDETKMGRFWFFSHNQAGAGRGVDVFFPCRVWRLVPFAITEENARNHPKARHYATIWGNNHPDHLRVIAALVEGIA